MKIKGKLLTIIILLIVAWRFNNTSASQTVDSYFDQVKKDPTILSAFIKKMPKGGVLHLHLAGSVHAEDLIAFAAEDNYCLDRSELAITKNCKDNLLMKDAISDKDLYEQLIDAWSIRNLKADENPETHFYSIFEKYYPIIENHSGYLLVETAKAAYEDHISYMEIMYSPNTELIEQYSKEIQWVDDLNALYQQIRSEQFDILVAETHHKLISDISVMKDLLSCTKQNANPACDIAIKFQYQINRELPLNLVFSQMVMGFELTQKYPEYVAVNLVGKEYSDYAVSNYDLHMKMIHFLHQKYPQVKVSLHAGEKEPLINKNIHSDHIEKAITIAHANRIGHGTNILNNNSPESIATQMSLSFIPVEISLASNRKLLGVNTKINPVLFYLSRNVPIVLSTDDPGILRTNINEEFVEAIMAYDLTYEQVKQLIRNSLSYSFLSGESLWIRPGFLVTSCQDKKFEDSSRIKSCAAFIAKSEKATLQWELEQEFNAFENEIKTKTSFI